MVKAVKRSKHGTPAFEKTAVKDFELLPHVKPLGAISSHATCLEESSFSEDVSSYKSSSKKWLYVGIWRKRGNTWRAKRDTPPLNKVW